VVVPCGVDICSFDHLNELDCLATLADLATSPLSGLSGSCNKLADNVPLLISLLESELTPEEICILIGECSSAVVVAKANDNCEMCKVVVTLVETQLKSGDIATQIENVVHKFCSGLFCIVIFELNQSINQSINKV
jgi:hypothetical protein